MPRRLFRRGSWEQATIIEVSATGALVKARANRAIRRGARISIALGPDRGLVTVRRIDTAANPPMSYYGVQFVWLDPDLKKRFDDAASTASSHEWRHDSASERPVCEDVISLR
ncbi:MAG TPA: hypothetical protein VM282_19635 [Acidimicrobiales bacterium]|nr:hypothetical protein [Acidimicrobiales bacterium]